MKLSRLLILLLLLPLFVSSQNVSIKGNAPQYKGEELIFYTYSDQITYSKRELARCRVQEDGNFLCSASIKEVSPAFINFEVFKCAIYLEPNSTYEVQLPPKTERTEDDKRNPFFERVITDLEILNSKPDELNFLIRTFDASYYSYLNKHYQNILIQNYKGKVDTIIDRFNVYFADIDNKYFNDYMYYRLASLKQMAYKYNDKYTTREFLLDRPILYNNPAYMELFNQTYSNYFSNWAKTQEGSTLESVVNYSKSFRKIIKTLDKNIALPNDTLKEIIALKGLFNAFYAKEFTENAVLQVLDSAYHHAVVPQHKEIAVNIKKALTHLMEGTYAPAFELLNKDSILFNLSDIKDKIIYLNFCTTWSYTCKEEFELLKNLQNKYSSALEVVTIFTDGDFSTMKEYLNENQYEWTFLHYANQPEILEDYNIKVFPTYFLIAPDGILINSPALSPNENIEETLKKYIKPKEQVRPDDGTKDLFINPE